MFKRLITILVLLVSACKHDTTMHMVFEDTFKGIELDQQKWNTNLKVFGRISDSYHNRSYQNIISFDDVIVNNGLFLRSRVSTGSMYSSGMVSSHEKFVFKYGYIEILAKYPHGEGVWPAFWLMPQDQTWPPEIDVAEFYGGKKMMHTGLCYGQFPNIKWDSDGYSNEYISDVYSTYGLYWTEKDLIWYQNGVVMKHVKGKHIPKIPMYIILSNGVSNKYGPAGVADPEKNFPNFLEVKYIRVYTFEN